MKPSNSSALLRKATTLQPRHLFLYPAALFLTLVLAACDSSDDPDVAEADSFVTVAYEGRLEDGTVFDSSSSAAFSLQQVIPGFRAGVVGMREGETKTFSVAPENGYGANPPDGSGIPPNATLIFEVTLLDVR